MNIPETIKKRRSVRTFAGTQLSPEDKHPRRIVLCGDKAHFYEKKSKSTEDGAWDIQKIDMGISLCHFELAAAEKSISPWFAIDKPAFKPMTGLHTSRHIR